MSTIHLNQMFKLLAAVAFAAPLLAYAHGEADHGAPKAISTEEHAFGVQGDPKSATRTITVAMRDTMRFVPASIPVREGETVTFVIRNDGKILHELVIGTPADLTKHAEMMRQHPGMEHDEPFMAHVKPGATERLTWRFTKGGNFEFACLIPGHYEAGMKGVIKVAARGGEAAATARTTAQPTSGGAMLAQGAHGATHGSASASPGAATGPATPSSTSPQAAATASTSLAEGEVRKVDLAAGKITLRHGEVKSIDMPPMTMVFSVADPALLQGRKVGEKVRFDAEKRNGSYVVTRIEVAP